MEKILARNDFGVEFNVHVDKIEASKLTDSGVLVIIVGGFNYVAVDVNDAKKLGYEIKEKADTIATDVTGDGVDALNEGDGVDALDAPTPKTSKKK